MNNPLITIITVVYNGVETLDETIASIRAIRYKPLEYIIVDGESTDGTLNIIQRNKDMITRWVSERDQGIYDAMNKGWRLASDESYVLYIGSGDRVVALPEDMTKYGSSEVLYGAVYMGQNVVFKPRVDFHLKLYNTLHHQALLVKKSLHPGAPFNLKYKVFADFDFNQRLFKSGAHFSYCEDLKCYALPGGVSDEAAFSESLMVIRKNFGPIWALIASVAHRCMHRFPFMSFLRPLQPIARRGDC
ncbi:glycosyltransferase family 2 protein [Geomobilimonas luticola]|uniref:Glycosyltransferase n=1 Tax=Geomobilimonas luticola TaxID=1114878 RepID=A0ABS5SCB4_9BACT|nr:glycosyltransferase family 2 protein [Geomobilimonas luticola]MBT0653018.1 glycosyltransferase [Geomobilimonas luticola]